jgi:hypothetical protein
MDGATYQLQRAALSSAASMHGVNTRLVFALLEHGRIEAETVPFIKGVTGSLDIRAGDVRDTTSRKSTINVKLYFDAPVRLGFIKSPACDVMCAGFVNRAAKRGMKSCEVEACGKRSDEQRFDNRLCNQVVRQSR